MAMSAVDCALWDLKALLLELPLQTLLGAVHDSVPVYGSGGFTTYDERQLTEQLSARVDGQGIPRSRSRSARDSGTAEERDLRRVAQAGRSSETPTLRGRERRLHRRSGPSDHVGSIGVRRDVVRRASVGGRSVRAACRLRTDQHRRDGWGVRVRPGQPRADVRGAVDCVQLDFTRCGGITELLRIAAAAEAHGLRRREARFRL
jgi:hypothetical protein